MLIFITFVRTKNFFLTEDTVIGILSLADEDQVSEVIKRRENIIIGSISKALNHDSQQIDLHTLL